MLNAKLNPSARELYFWMLRRQRHDRNLKVDLQDFQAWASEYGEKAYSHREVKDALKRLQQKQLIAIASTEVTFKIKESPERTLLPEDIFLLEEFKARRKKVSSSLNPLMLVSLVTLSSFLVGLIPVAVGLAVASKSQPTISAHNPWQVLIDKDSKGSHSTRS
ncbi:MAG: hypothetical protein F6J93_17540 [Oscillatoria sp. SIO1A7]|nr:hypothetical protein [Oscillatoria sp. SIO1A7]